MYLILKYITNALSQVWDISIENDNRSFAHSRFDSNIIRFSCIFNMSYFPDDGQNGPRYSRSNGKHSEFHYSFLIISRYLHLVKRI